MNKESQIAVYVAFEKDTNWCEGVVGNYTFQAKVYDNGSLYGINQGRVSKLCMWNEEGTWVNYERGWDMEPGEDVKQSYDALMYVLENSPERFSED